MKKNTAGIVVFLLPTLILFGLIFGASTVIIFGSSFFKWQLASKISYNGIQNYIDMMKDDTFHVALKNTLIWSLLQSSVHIFIGVTVAFILARRQFYWKFVRTVYIIPNIISSAALGVLYVSIFNSRIGIVNSLIRLIGFKNFDINWFSDFNTAFITVTLTWLPYAAVCTILVLGEIAAIDETIIEAARIDGASRLATDIFIILPVVKNIIVTCVILAATSALKNFDLIFITTNGGPGNITTNLPIYVYKTAMLENNYSYANTLSVSIIIIGVLMILTISKSFKLGKTDI